MYEVLVVPKADIAKYVADIHVQMCNNGLVFWMFIYFQVNAICFYLFSVSIQNPFEKIQLTRGTLSLETTKWKSILFQCIFNDFGHEF